MMIPFNILYHWRPVLLEGYGSDIGDIDNELLGGDGSTNACDTSVLRFTGPRTTPHNLLAYVWDLANYNYRLSSS